MVVQGLLNSPTIGSIRVVYCVINCTNHSQTIPSFYVTNLGFIFYNRSYLLLFMIQIIFQKASLNASDIIAHYTDRYQDSPDWSVG